MDICGSLSHNYYDLLHFYDSFSFYNIPQYFFFN